MHDEFVGNENPEVIGERRWRGRRNGREDVGIGGRGGRRGGGDGRGRPWRRMQGQEYWYGIGVQEKGLSVCGKQIVCFHGGNAAKS